MSRKKNWFFCVFDEWEIEVENAKIIREIIAINLNSDEVFGIFNHSFSLHTTTQHSALAKIIFYFSIFLFLIFYSIDYVCHNKLPFIPSRHASSYLFSHPFTLSLSLTHLLALSFALDLILMPLECPPVSFFIHSHMPLLPTMRAIEWKWFSY